MKNTILWVLIWCILGISINITYSKNKYDFGFSFFNGVGIHVNLIERDKNEYNEKELFDTMKNLDKIIKRDT